MAIFAAYHHHFLGIEPQLGNQRVRHGAHIGLGGLHYCGGVGRLHRQVRAHQGFHFGAHCNLRLRRYTFRSCGRRYHAGWSCFGCIVGIRLLGYLGGRRRGGFRCALGFPGCIFCLLLSQSGGFLLGLLGLPLCGFDRIVLGFLLRLGTVLERLLPGVQCIGHSAKLARLELAFERAVVLGRDFTLHIFEHPKGLEPRCVLGWHTQTGCTLQELLLGFEAGVRRCFGNLLLGSGGHLLVQHLPSVHLILKARVGIGCKLTARGSGGFAKLRGIRGAACFRCGLGFCLWEYLGQALVDLVPVEVCIQRAVPQQVALLVLVQARRAAVPPGACLFRRNAGFAGFQCDVILGLLPQLGRRGRIAQGVVKLRCALAVCPVPHESKRPQQQSHAQAALGAVFGNGSQVFRLGAVGTLHQLRAAVLQYLGAGLHHCVDTHALGKWLEQVAVGYRLSDTLHGRARFAQHPRQGFEGPHTHRSSDTFQRPLDHPGAPSGSGGLIVGYTLGAKFILCALCGRQAELARRHCGGNPLPTRNHRRSNGGSHRCQPPCAFAQDAGHAALSLGVRCPLRRACIRSFNHLPAVVVCRRAVVGHPANHLARHAGEVHHGSGHTLAPNLIGVFVPWAVLCLRGHAEVFNVPAEGESCQFCHEIPVRVRFLTEPLAHVC